MRKLLACFLGVVICIVGVFCMVTGNRMTADDREEIRHIPDFSWEDMEKDELYLVEDMYLTGVHMPTAEEDENQAMVMFRSEDHAFIVAFLMVDKQSDIQDEIQEIVESGGLTPYGNIPLDGYVRVGTLPEKGSELYDWISDNLDKQNRAGVTIPEFEIIALEYVCNESGNPLGENKMADAYVTAGYILAVLGAIVILFGLLLSKRKAVA